MDRKLEAKKARFLWIGLGIEIVVGIVIGSLVEYLHWQDVMRHNVP
jgi:hypothetical protein